MKNLSVQFNPYSGAQSSWLHVQSIDDNYFDKVELLLEMIDETLQQAVAGIREEDQLNPVSAELICTLNQNRQKLIDLKILLQGPRSILWPEIKAKANLLMREAFKAISLL